MPPHGGRAARGDARRWARGSRSPRATACRRTPSTSAPQHPSSHGVIQLRIVRRGRPDRGGRAAYRVRCTAARRSCSRCATTARRWCWRTGTTGCRRSATSSASRSPSSGCSAWRCPSGRRMARTLLAELNRVLRAPGVPRLLPRCGRRAVRRTTRSTSARPLQRCWRRPRGGRMHLMFNRSAACSEDAAGVVDGARARAAAGRARGPRADRRVAARRTPWSRRRAASAY